MRGTSAEETLHIKEAHKRLAATHGSRVCAYRADNGILSYPHFKDATRICVKQTSFYGVLSHNQNMIVDRRIKEPTLGSWTLLLHSTRLCSEAVRIILWNFYFKSDFKRYNSL